MYVRNISDREMRVGSNWDPGSQHDLWRSILIDVLECAIMAHCIYIQPMKVGDPTSCPAGSIG
jgi:hypothetical protein